MTWLMDRGFCFGLTSGVITTLGLIVGLNTATSSRLAVIGGILSIAFADAFSDALGMHISEESQQGTTTKRVWKSTLTTFLAKFFFALTFMIPVLLFTLTAAVWISIVWGLALLIWLSFKISKIKHEKTFNVIREHLSIAVLVLILTYFVGKLVALYFGG